MEERRRRRLAIGGGLAVLAILIGVLLGWSATRGFQGKYAPPRAGTELPATPAGPVPPPVGAPLPPPVILPPDDPPPPPPPDEADDADADDTVADAIDAATLRALRRGEPVRWHEDGYSGYVTVSAEQAYPDRICRNVSATVEAPGGGIRSRSQLWCASADDDDWAPE